MKEEILKKLNYLINIMEADEIYPYPTPRLVASELQHLIDIYVYNREKPINVLPGTWIQVHEQSTKPYYAKVIKVCLNNTVVLEGVYDYKEGKATPRVVDLKRVMMVSNELAEQLEFENGLNIYKSRPYNIMDN